MPEAHRVMDQAKAEGHCHGCPASAHTVVGPLMFGSPDVLVNNKPAGRKTDMGLAAPCCGPNLWVADAGSGTVFINGLEAFRKDDATKHCGGAGTGMSIQGSPDVLIGG